MVNGCHVETTVRANEHLVSGPLTIHEIYGKRYTPLYDFSEMNLMFKNVHRSEDLNGGAFFGQVMRNVQKGAKRGAKEYNKYKDTALVRGAQAEIEKRAPAYVDRGRRGLKRRMSDYGLEGVYDPAEALAVKKYKQLRGQGVLKNFSKKAKSGAKTGYSLYKKNADNAIVREARKYAGAQINKRAPEYVDKGRRGVKRGLSKYGMESLYDPAEAMAISQGRKLLKKKRLNISGGDLYMPQTGGDLYMPQSGGDLYTHGRARRY